MPIAVQDHDYATAWAAASINRVDLAVLVAFRWPDFLQHASDLVHAVPHDQDMVDILSSLQPVDGSGGLLSALKLVAVGINDLVRCKGCAGALLLQACQGAPCRTSEVNVAVVHEGFSQRVTCTTAQQEPCGPLCAVKQRWHAARTGCESCARGSTSSQHTGRLQADGAGSPAPVAEACAAVRQALRDAGPGRYLRPLLTSHLLLEELGEALALIKQRKEAALSASTSGGPPLCGTPPTSGQPRCGVLPQPAAVLSTQATGSDRCLHVLLVLRSSEVHALLV